MRRADWLLAGAAALARVPFVRLPVSPDEGGYLLVASQWRPGHSLYGHYWVDRPPLLLALFDLAAHLGGAAGLRAIGIAAVAATVLLAGHLTREVTGALAWGPALVAAVFASTPLFGTTEVDGELLAVPLVLLAVVALVRARSGPAGWSVAAGAASMAAVLVKQNVVDGFVVATVLVLSAARREGGRRAAALGAGVGVGALATLTASLALAEARGTEPRMLWDAVVAFRARASVVIDASASGATSHRLVLLLVACLLSGAPLLVAVLALRLRGTPAAAQAPDLRLPAVALLLWEAVAVVAGGSYWLHYLLGLVPGMVVLTVAALQRPVRLARTSVLAVGVATMSCTVAIALAATSATTRSVDVRVASYLRSRSAPHDSVVVGFGHPDIVWDSGLRSPYEELWSLPVRVRDPALSQLTEVLRGARAPTWVVVSGSSLATWGVDASDAERVLDRRYRRTTTIGSYVVWHRVPRSQVA